MSTLVSLVLQTMIERPTIDRAGEIDVAIDRLRNATFHHDGVAGRKDGVAGAAVIRLGIATRSDGDAENRLLQMVFSGPASELQIQHNKLLTRFFGAEDSVLFAKDDDGELLAASRRAKQALAKLKPRFTPKPPQLEQLVVKAPFTTPGGGVEWMWVEVVRWEGTRIKGILENDPGQVPNLKAGALVEVDEDSLFDYLLRRRDGTTKGNETSKILEARDKVRR
jgi:uncharacterized protein YegJ (DUF2314 family)